MHYYALAVIPAEGDVDDLVEEAMAPHSEDRHDDGIWDWYQIGGRYTGRLSGYDPRKDENLLEACFLCGATGLRDDEPGRKAREANPGYTCNGCRGEGRCLMWTGEWPRHDGDIVAVDQAAAFVASLEDRHLPFTIIAHGSEGKPVERESWNGEQIVTQYDDIGIRTMLETMLLAREKAGFLSRVVVVDYHS